MAHPSFLRPAGRSYFREMERTAEIWKEFVDASPRARRISLLLMAGFALWSCWQMYLLTRPEEIGRIQIMLPDPVVVHFMLSYMPIVLITISLLVLGRVHIPLALLLVLTVPLWSDFLAWLDRLPIVEQPSPVVMLVTAPLPIATLMVLLRPRFRRLDALAVVGGFWIIITLYMFYHLAFLWPIYEHMQVKRDEMVAQLERLPPDLLAREMELMGAEDFSAMTPETIERINAMSDMIRDHSFPGESAQRIWDAAPATTHAWTVVGWTFADKRVLLYDGRPQLEGGDRRLWGLPADFAQTDTIIATGGYYLTMAIAAWFWTLMPLYLVHVHGPKADRIAPFSRKKLLPPPGRGNPTGRP